MSKSCSKCGVSKLLQIFGKRSAAPDGHNPVCKPCVKEKQKARRSTKEFKEKRNLKNALPAAKAKKKKADAKRRADPGFIEREKTRTGTAEFKAKKSAYQKEYQARPETKELINARNALPANVLKRKAYNGDPINKEKKAKYNDGYKDTRNEKRRERYATDIKYRTMNILRARLTNVLGNMKQDHTRDLIGCTVEQMVQHVESQFTPGMNWENQGKGEDEWEIDHIIPFAAFDLSIVENQFIVCWYQNLQPLWGPDNRSKGAKYTEEGKQLLICKYNEYKKGDT